MWKNTDCKPLDIEQYIVLCSNLSCIMFYSEVPNFNLFKNVKSIIFIFIFFVKNCLHSKTGYSDFLSRCAYTGDAWVSVKEKGKVPQT